MIHYAPTDNNILALAIEGGFEERELSELQSLLDHKLRQFDSLRMYLEITKVSDPESVFKEIGMHLALLKDFDRTALVLDSGGALSVAEHGDPLFACPIQGFEIDQREQAQAWISQN